MNVLYLKRSHSGRHFDMRTPAYIPRRRIPPHNSRYTLILSNQAHRYTPLSCDHMQLHFDTRIHHGNLDRRILPRKVHRTGRPANRLDTCRRRSRDCTRRRFGRYNLGCSLDRRCQGHTSMSIGDRCNLVCSYRHHWKGHTSRCFGRYIVGYIADQIVLINDQTLFTNYTTIAASSLRCDLLHE